VNTEYIHIPLNTRIGMFEGFEGHLGPIRDF